MKPIQPPAVGRQVRVYAGRHYGAIHRVFAEADGGRTLIVYHEPDGHRFAVHVSDVEEASDE